MKLEAYTEPKTYFITQTVYWKLTKSDSYVPIINITGKIDSMEESELLKFYLNEEFYDDTTSYRIINFSDLQNNTNTPFRLNPIYKDRFIFIKGNFSIEENNVFDTELEALNYCSGLLKKEYYDGKIRIYDDQYQKPKFVEALEHTHFISFEIKHDQKNGLGYFKITGAYPGPTKDLEDDILETKRLYSALKKFLRFSGIKHVIIDITDFKYQYLDKYLEDFMPSYEDFESNPFKVSYIINKNTDTTYGFVKNSKLFFDLDEAIKTLELA